MCFKHSLSLLNNLVMEYLGKLEIHTSVKGGHTVTLQMNDIQFELATDMHWKTNGEDKYRVAT